jgi:hypothetical protein
MGYSLYQNNILFQLQDNPVFIIKGFDCGNDTKTDDLPVV